MGKTKSEMKKEAKKKERRNKIEAQRNIRHAAPKPPTMDPKTFTAKLMPDYLQLTNGVEQLKKISDQRIKAITNLKAKDPDTYRHLDLNAYETYRKGLDNMDAILRKVAEFIGQVEDVSSYAEKMVIIHDNIGLMSEAMNMFQIQIVALQGLDESFKAQMPQAPQPEVLDVPKEDTQEVADAAPENNPAEDTSPEEQSASTTTENTEQVAPEVQEEESAKVDSPSWEEVPVTEPVEEKTSHPIKITGLD